MLNRNLGCFVANAPRNDLIASLRAKRSNLKNGNSYAIDFKDHFGGRKWASVLIGLIALSSFFAGRAAGPSRLERDYGTSVKLARFNQILNPEAEKNLEPVTGLDGSAANTAIETYRKGFEKAAPPVPYILGIGSAR